MRIISGSRKGLQIAVPHGLPVRPTTDRARESLFNILETRYDLEGMLVLDLFSGTGSMAFEFASRGVADVTCVDADNKCVKHLNEVIRKYDFENVSVVRSDVFRFLQQPAEPVNIIFADPPYDLPHYDRMKQLIFENGWLQPDGIFIAEHHTKNNLVKDADFLEERIYGQSAFTFYKKK